MPHSRFRGHGDGTWSDLDRRKARAYLHYLKQVCQTCGTRPDEWDETQGGDEDAYRATTHRCIGCQILQDRQKTLPDGDEAHGMKVALIPTSVAAALELEKSHRHQ
ncbi:hypothetical protein OIE75_40760 (plasmid) [Streptomyces sp. NBC_01723]|uniref:hypothetical protein n=1 Tax=Streptomyces sp. NBC_01723 TaxID=2975921 RepID=UPI002E3331C8|nr:hypothetical protein [Streptomyces sp. NBC_01723]